MKSIFFAAGLVATTNALAVSNGTSTSSARKSKCTAKCQMNACYAAVNSGPSSGLQDCSSFVGTSTVYETATQSAVTETIQATITPLTTTLYETLVAQTLTTTFSTFIQVLDITSTFLDEVTEIISETETDLEHVTITQLAKRQTDTPTTSSESALPSYVGSACPNPSAFQSVCSCLGVSTQATTTITQTLAPSTSTITLISTVEATDLETISPTQIISEVASAEITSYFTEIDTEILSQTQTIVVTAVQTQTVDVAQPSNAYCQNGMGVNGLSASCNQAGCSTTNLRIEGPYDTLYEGIILAGPRTITTASGGSHVCDGTNNAANPVPFNNVLTPLDAAGQLCDFTFDGTFFPQYDDFFITAIGDTTNAGSDIWDFLVNYAYPNTAGGPCEVEIQPTDEVLWAFDASNLNYFLRVEPVNTPVVLAPGQSTTFTVQGSDGSDGSFVDIAGATFNGETSDSAGNVAFTAPVSPGTYFYKATRPDSLRSNAVQVVVQG